MKCLILCYTLVIILVLVKSEYCVSKEFNTTEAHCGIYDTDSIFYSIPQINRDITYIDLFGQPLKQLPNNAFKVLRSQRNITTVTLRYCQIGHIDVDAFMNLDNLELVDLSFNNISQFDVGTFRNVPKVKYIFLEYNHISVLPEGFVVNLTSLIRIHLDYNVIAHIEENAFKNTPKLQHIDLSHNKLESLMLLEEYLVNKTYLYLHDNPWTCNDSIFGIYNYSLHCNKKYDIKYIPRCENPLEFRGRKWNEIPFGVIRQHISPQELNDEKEEPPKTSLLALVVGAISDISFLASFMIYIGLLIYLYNIRRNIYAKVTRRSEVSNTE